VRILSFIRRARELGFSIEDIRALLALAEPGRGSCSQVRKIANAHLLDVRRKLADLARLETILSDASARCSDGPAPTCPVLDMLGEPSPSLVRRDR
jgi:MerR family mercuric resistance operon transcriptional regulator